MAVAIQRAEPKVAPPIEDLIVSGAQWGDARRLHIVRRKSFGGVTDCVGIAQYPKDSRKGATYVCLTRQEAQEMVLALQEMLDQPPSKKIGTVGL